MASKASQVHPMGLKLKGQFTKKNISQISSVFELTIDYRVEKTTKKPNFYPFWAHFGAPRQPVRLLLITTNAINSKVRALTNLLLKEG